MTDHRSDSEGVSAPTRRHRFEDGSNKRQKASPRALNVHALDLGDTINDMKNLSQSQLIEMLLNQQAETKRIQTENKKIIAKLNARGKKRGIRRTSMKPMELIASGAQRIPELSLDEKKRRLNNIGIQGDSELSNAKGLQVLLWELGCNYCLQKHQFRAVRAIAVGMSDKGFPGPIDPDSASQNVKEVLRRTDFRLSNKGFIIGDVMGLGKTVEAVAGAILRNAIAEAQNKPRKPTLICTPNEAILMQWVDTLIKAGVEQNKISRFKTKQSDPLQGDVFVLCTIYDLQTECRYSFTSTKKSSGRWVAHRSPLFANASGHLLGVLKNQYRADRGLSKNQFSKEGETVNACIRRYLARYQSKCELTFRTAIIDEAHFVRNLKTFWGSAAALIGLHSECILPMSGTPYNNTAQDIATLMSFIDAKQPSAREKWWKEATKDSAAKMVMQKIKEWNENFLIRRGKDVIASQLPPKTINQTIVTLTDTELAAYERTERSIFFVLKRLHSAQNKGNPKELKECLMMFMAVVANAMLAVGHPVLQNGGRDMTVFFSPTRSSMTSVHKSQEKQKVCVHCRRRMNSRQLSLEKNEPNLDTIEADEEAFENLFESMEEGALAKNKNPTDNTSCPDKKTRKATRKLPESYLTDGAQDSKNDSEYEDSDDEMEGDHEFEPDATELEEIVEEESDDEPIDGDDENYDTDDDEDAGEAQPKGRGQIVPIPTCKTGLMGIRHFACESCIESIDKCPRCEVLLGKLQNSSLRENKNTDVSLSTKDETAKNQGVGKDNWGRRLNRIFCPEVFGGFLPSSKLKAIVSTFDKIPRSEKALIVSFYKGGLDLLERMFTDLYPNMQVARFDGDIGVNKREKILQEFKSIPSCRVLLMTVQTGGVGLNLVEANHVLFFDRHWNPMIMEQCEDRCYRIGQGRKVSIFYHDTKDTIDQAMATINCTKTSNAGIILADGPALRANLSFKDTAGLFGQQLRSIREGRQGEQQKVTNGPSKKTILHDRSNCEGSTPNVDGAASKGLSSLLPSSSSKQISIASGPVVGG